MFRKVWHFVTRYKPQVPRESVRVVPNYRSLIWTMGKYLDRECMHVRAELYVTNIIDQPVRILNAQLLHPAANLHLLLGSQIGTHTASPEILISQEETIEISVFFMIEPPVRKAGEDFKARIVLEDQFGNKHKLKRLVFKGQ